MTNRKKVAVVTGGAAGIGAAISRFLARDGADIAIWDWKIDNVQPLVDEIRALGRNVVVSKVDVSKRADIEQAVKKVRDELGPVSILVNNAGISPEKNFEEITEEDWDAVMNVNLKGTFLCTQAVIADMKAAKWGRIVNISSSSAQSGARRMVHYAATKGGVISFTKALAQEMGPFSITVNNVPPSFVHTAGLDTMADRLSSQGGIEGYAKSTIPLQRVGQPEDLAAAVAFLASDAAGYITGHTLSVNGGRYMA